MTKHIICETKRKIKGSPSFEEPSTTTACVAVEWPEIAKLEMQVKLVTNSKVEASLLADLLSNRLKNILDDFVDSYPCILQEVRERSKKA